MNNVRVDLYFASDLTTSIANTLTANNPVGGAAGWYQFIDLARANYVVNSRCRAAICSRCRTLGSSNDTD